MNKQKKMSQNKSMKITIKIKLKEVRQKKNITIRQLAVMSGISKSQIADIENEKSIPTLYSLCKLAVALHVAPEKLYEYEITTK